MTAARKSQATQAVHDASTADPRAWRVLWTSTFAFTICFAIWMMFAILGIPLKTQLGLSDTEFGLIAATP
ncbi:MAG TPA: MFS transporter, partial [Caballeronia sp.]|nr:MFS transporter [Caballeronia sp.]